MLKIPGLDEHRLAVMSALKNMVGKAGHNHPGLSGHQLLLAFGTQTPFRALNVEVNRTTKPINRGSN